MGPSLFHGGFVGIPTDLSSDPSTVGKVMAVTPTQLGIQGAIPQNFKFLEKGIITILERNLI
ncbi:hypothetical protein [Leptospira sp. P2653]|uniref:hypothetical protein n=1 Tax=Leptospira sp. P2653 TaxID=1218600 RepID=UPI0002BF82A0|nr:hypothetical protein [Leptospira sp. P2653]EMJ62483.1 hypothetical protein LEP1GSC051_1638 [Leptospira sp. P2653]